MKDIYFGREEAKLHGVITISDAPGAPGVVICHPHPQFGGSMDNNVVLGLEAALSDADYTTLRFNFRGVGRSGGEHGGGDAEMDDVIRAVDLLSADSSVGAIYVAGYSFGAMVGLKAALRDDRVSALVGVAPPTSLGSFDFLAGNLKPLLIVVGADDGYCEPSSLKQHIKPGSDKLETISGADHFFIGHENRVGDIAVQFLSALPR
jgi:hypothetical protein